MSLFVGSCNVVTLVITTYSTMPTDMLSLILFEKFYSIDTSVIKFSDS